MFDTGATVSISNDRNDFISWDKKRDCQSLRGVTEEAKVQGFGIVEWKISDVGGRHQTIKTQYCYVPDAAVRLFSPQAFFAEENKGGFVVSPKRMIFFFPDEHYLTLD